MTGIHYCIICGKEFDPSNPEVVICPACSGLPAIPPAGNEQKAIQPAQDQLQAADNTWQPGQVILDTYEVKGELGKGGFGRVYRVHHKTWNMDLAVKRALNLDEQGKQAFIDEAQKWIDLGLQPHIISCYYVRNIDGFPHTFAELAEGGSLESWIQRGRYDLYAGEPGQVLSRILDIAIQFAWGLSYAHQQGLVHQDVKPGNALMSAHGILKVTDFGLAKARGNLLPGSAPVPGGGKLVSSAGYTLAYRSPEQAAGKKLSPATDIWSWAVSVLEMFNGGVSWLDGQGAAASLESCLQHTGEEDIPAMPPAVTALLLECFQNDPLSRPKDMFTIVDRLVAIYLQVIGHAYFREMPKAADLRADSLNNKAVSMLDIGQANEAQALWAAAIELSPHHAESVINASYQRWQLGLHSDETFLEKFRELEPLSNKDPHYWRSLGLFHVERGALEEAASALDQAIALMPGNPSLTIESAAVHVKLGDEGQSIARQQLSAADPSPHITFGLSEEELLASLSDLDLPRVVLEQTLKPAPVLPKPGESPRSRLYNPLAYNPFTSNSLSGWISEVCFSPQGDRAYSIADGKLKQWDLHIGFGIATAEGPPLGRTVFSSDRSHLLAVSAGKLVLYSLPDLQEMASIPLPIKNEKTVKVESLALSQDLSLAALGTGELEGCFLFDLKNSRLLHTLVAHKYSRSVHKHVCFSPDQSFLLTGGGNEICVWDANSGFCRRTIEVVDRGYGVIREMQALPDGQGVLVCDSHGVLQSYDLRTGKMAHHFVGHEGNVWGLSISDDGRRMLAAGYDKSLRLFDLNSGRCMHSFSLAHKDVVSCAAFSPDGEWGISGGHDRKLNVWLLHFPVTQAKGIIQLRFSPLISLPRSSHDVIHLADQKQNWMELAQEQRAAGKWAESYLTLRKAQAQPGYEQDREILTEVVTLGRFGRRVTLRDAWELKTLPGPGDKIEALCFSPDNKSVLAAAGNQGIVRWDLANGESSRLSEIKSRTVALDISPKGDRLLIGTGNWAGGNKTLLYDLGSQRVIHTWEHEKGLAGGVFFSAGGHLAVSRCGLKLKVHDCSTGAVKNELSFDHPLSGAAVSPDGRFLLGRTDHGHIQLYDRTSDQWFANIVTGRVLVMRVTHDGRRLITGSESGTVEIFDLFTGDRLQAWEEHQEAVCALIISPDDRFIFSAGGSMNRSRDSAVRVLDLQTTACLRKLEGTAQRVEALALSPDGRYLVSGGSDPSLHLWELDWEFEFPGPADWDEGARPYLENFLTLHTSQAGEPAWSETDFQELLISLGYHGYGWLREEGVRRKLEEMARERR